MDSGFMNGLSLPSLETLGTFGDLGTASATSGLGSFAGGGDVVVESSFSLKKILVMGGIAIVLFLIAKKVK